MESFLKAFVCLLMLNQALGFVINPREDEVPDEEKTVPQWIEKYGYPAETHHITTEDGYILGVHRIPYSPNSPAAEGKPAVLIKHGLLTSSGDFIIQGPEKSLAFILSDLGYDVWLGNDRGNFYSRNHTTLDPNDSQFWKFDWNEIGTYDLPATIDYILEQTGQEKIYYIGHSMGTTQSLVFLSERPEYNEKMKAVILLAPVSTLTNATNPITLLVPYLNSLQFLLKLLGVNELLPHSMFFAHLEERCKQNAQNPELCGNVIYALLGDAQVNKTVLPYMIAQDPAGTATRNLIHFGQVIRDKRFQKYDYGVLGNLRTYGRIVPPLYDLSKIAAPVSLHYSDSDNFADLDDVNWLSQQLPNLAGEFRVSLSSFTHVDFIWGQDANTLVYNTVTSVMEQYL